MNKFDVLYMDIARRISDMSYSTRSRVGCIIVNDHNIVSFGWNGTPRLYDNRCEDDSGRTLDCVIHAEQNAIAKAARQGIPLYGSTLYTTLSPCFDCSKSIIQSGIKSVIYFECYRVDDAIVFLRDNNINVYQMEEDYHV